MANFEINEKIIIELNSGRLYEGDFIRETGDGIDVNNSKDLTTNKVKKYAQHFYRSEIKSVRTLNPKSADSNANSPSTSTQETAERRRIFTQSINNKTFNADEIEHIQSFTKNAVYISQFDDKYYEAIKEIKRHKLIAVNSEGIFGRLDPKRPLIAIATPNHVYLFDMLRLGPMKKELKQIFTSDSPRKIVHSSAEIADYLQHIETCTLNNAFDTLMVHFTLKQTRTRISLQDCFKMYFDLPDNFPLQNFNYQVRPLEIEAKARSALNVLLLIELYWYFQDILMKPLQIATQQFAATYPNVENQVDLLTHMNNGEYPGCEDIDINAAAYLADEFEQLTTN